MAIITDPDLIGRYDVIFGVAGQKVSIYPVGDTQRGSTIVNTYVSGTGELTNTDSTGWVGVTEGDVAAVISGPDAGHYFVDASPTINAITLVDIDSGFDGSAITSLTVADTTVDMTSVVSNEFTVTGHGYVSGDAVVLSAAGTGSIDTALTVGTVYYIVWVDANTISLATSYANATASTPTVITLNDDGTSTDSVFSDRIKCAVFNNGASSVVSGVTPNGEFINNNETTGDDDGDVKDGITLQALYSYGKDEWRVDSLITDLSGDYNDDLIRYEFPFEAITSEQFEIGGGAAHDNWNWFNVYSRKKVRTGGWAEKTRTQVGDQDLARWTGVVTLGTLDADTQVYYQQVDVNTTKVDFTFTGAVNEAIQVIDDPNQDGVFADGFDRRNYLKIFARKKGRTYAQSEIADIGVTSLQTIVNRFPLTAIVDAAITITDGQIEGTAPYQFAADPNGTSSEIETGTDGSKSTGFVFTSTSADFTTAGVEAGDTLRIVTDPTSSTPEVGYYTIASVNSATSLTVEGAEYIDGDGNFVFPSDWQSTDDGSDITYDVYTSKIVRSQTDGDGVGEGIINVAPATVASGALGELTDTTNANFVSSGVATGDILVITGGVTDTTDIGVYKIVDSAYDANAAAPTASTIYVNTSDEEWPSSRDGGVTYEIREPGMFLQFKDELTETKTASATINEDIVFNAANRTITLGSALPIWDSSIGPGTMIVVDGTVDNDGRYTVLSRDSDTQITLISTDTLVAETATAGTVEVREGFKREIGTGTFAYRWRLFGNNGTLQQVFQFVQKELRSSSDIDFGTGSSVGNVTDLLISFASPTATTNDMIIDNINTQDVNNATYQDHSGTSRNFPFTASGNLVFNNNLRNDSDAKYWLFFTNDDAGDDLGRDYGTEFAIIVQDADNVEIQGDVNGAGNHIGVAGTVDAANNISIPFTYDYDVNDQRGAASTATDAPVTLVAIGLNTAQFVIASGTITRATGVTISAVAALERNYLAGSV